MNYMFVSQIHLYCSYTQDLSLLNSLKSLYFIAKSFRQTKRILPASDPVHLHSCKDFIPS